MKTLACTHYLIARFFWYINKECASSISKWEGGGYKGQHVPNCLSHRTPSYGVERWLCFQRVSCLGKRAADAYYSSMCLLLTPLLTSLYNARSPELVWLIAWTHSADKCSAERGTQSLLPMWLVLTNVWLFHLQNIPPPLPIHAKVIQGTRLSTC